MVETNARELPFVRVRGNSPSAEVVHQIQVAIFDGRLSAGDQLPPERQLAEIFAVSRGTLRDALRTLQANGLIRVRVGAKGGTFVTAPQPDQLAKRITHMLALSELTAAEVTEARVILELGALPLICHRATDEDIDALEELCDRSDAALAAGTHTFHFSVAFHVRLAQASHSSATSLIIDSLHEPLLRSMVAAGSVAPRMAPQGALEHRDLVAAIRARDVNRAHAVLGEHLSRTLARVGGDPGLVYLPR
jgi:GntR family transcriptional regulator, transcriptional repressor for pyruvate dehydrogenase complex